MLQPIHLSANNQYINLAHCCCFLIFITIHFEDTKMVLPIQLNDNQLEPMELDVVDTPVVESVDIDLEAHMAPYVGLPRIYRLEFIADHCFSLKIQALEMALDYIVKNTCDVKDYVRLFKKLEDAYQSNRPQHMMLSPDTHWIEAKTKQANLRFERLDTDLKNYRCNSVKESIRRGQDDLGDHFLDCGELENAFAAYSKSRDYVITTKNQITQCLNVIRVSILLNRWPSVSSHVLRAEAQPADPQSCPASFYFTKLHCAAGLYELNARKYKRAAAHFLNTNFDHFQHPSESTSQSDCLSPVAGTSSSALISSSYDRNIGNRDCPNMSSQWDILAPVNIAVYGTLCALATYSRQELGSALINSSSLKQFSELDPQLREAAQKFYESKYASCLQILDSIKNVLLIDLYLAPHVDRLYRMIRNKALIQYFEPFSAANMHQMAAAFNTSVQELESEMMNLIYESQISARIDSQSKILYANETDPRTRIFEKALKVGKAWQSQARVLICKSAIVNAGLIPS